MSPPKRAREHLQFLYGPAEGEKIWAQLQARLEEFRKHNPRLSENAPAPERRLTERDAFLITYGDQISESGRPPLQTLAEFLEKNLREIIGGVHLLPHFPYSSDDGFSVIDYRNVNPELGNWDDVARIDKNFRLMFDGVINHISRKSDWFQKFLRGEAPYTDYFICTDSKTDPSNIVRPRTSPLLTHFETASGAKHVWTTFSDDQIDLNFKNPRVLLEIIALLLFYAERGAEVIRLDAIAYLWKEIGTPCIHLPQTHAVVKLFRAVFDAVAPRVMLITETNVPHADNIRYFGDGADEAQMVYNFALPPLILHTFHTGNARAFVEWAAALKAPSSATAFFNFLASHDGIGVVPARGLLSENEIQALVDRALAHGGKVSCKSNPDGSQSPYELNITLFDALNDPRQPDPELDIRRFLASQIIMLTLAGVPAIYAHSLFGSRNCHACVEKTGRARSINREKFQRAALEAELADEKSLKNRVFSAYKNLLRARRSHAEFHPNASQRVFLARDGVIGIVRGSTFLCLVNVTSEPHTVEISTAPHQISPSKSWRDVISTRVFMSENGKLRVPMDAYQAFWLFPA
jgi:glycosidase